ncbi:hypothetical protein AWB81_07172 [Caballeronia arationis]|nr:hypothetical protein AWB81_07172 [Caballeronia arationis]
MVKIELELSDEMHANLREVVARCNASHRDRDGANTHGQLSVKTLLTMLTEDAALTHSRPGSWEGANMQQVLDSHGYPSAVGAQRPAR